MAEIAAITSVASNVISSAIRSLAALGQAETTYLGDIPAKVQLIEAKLRVIQSYLKDNENKPRRDHLTTNWLQEMKKVTCQSQDVIDKILLLKQYSNRATGCSSVFSRYSNISGHLKSLHDVGIEIDRINNFIPEISAITKDLGTMNLGESSSMADQFEDPRTMLHFSDTDEVIGFEIAIMEITQDLLDPTYEPLGIVSLVGMGGIGKTTLAKKISNHLEIKRHFDVIAMITVSKDYNVLNLQKEILKATNKLKNEDVENMTEVEVGDELCGALEEKKYLIIIDDVWETMFWDKTNKTFPNKNNGSRILLTTRKLDVAKYPGLKNLVYEVELLDDEKSLELLKKRAFPPYVLVSEPIKKNLESLCPLFIRKCNGLPLALIVLGGYLSRHLDFQTWSRMAKAIDWEEAGNPINISKILALSYHDLPINLKPAFLYITAFPEDHIIECSDLIRLWIAEGFIPPNQRYNLETMGQIYLDELHKRGLVQVVERSRTYEWISKIKVHDVLHAWGVDRAKEEGLFHIMKHSDHANSHATQISYRAVFHGYCDKNLAILMPNLQTMLGFELPRKNVSLRKLNSLRVLCLTHRSEDNMKSPKHIKHMIFLRYICLRNCGNVYFPSSIGKLGNLQTLECHNSKIMSLPSSLWEISTLRHVHLHWICCGWNGSQKGIMGENLHTLIIHHSYSKNILLDAIIQRPSCMEGVALSLEEMKQIVHLVLNANYSLPRNLLSRISSLCNLEVLKLLKPIKGLTILPAKAFPLSILKLELFCEELVEDPMPVLQQLTKLVELNLGWGSQLMTMHCSSNGFPSLRYLTLTHFRVLEHWKVDCGAMPGLCGLGLYECENLKKFPNELMEHKQLRLVELSLSPYLSKIDYSELEENGCEVIKLER